jgi:hypothetical protein
VTPVRHSVSDRVTRIALDRGRPDEQFGDLGRSTFKG